MSLTSPMAMATPARDDVAVHPEEYMTMKLKRHRQRQGGEGFAQRAADAE
ncbi:MAG: hypothetical protein U0746_10415 [Gemmataceae bacterium]